MRTKDDEYFADVGKTLSELYDLNGDDPLPKQRPVSQPSPFVDPPEDEDLTIRDQSSLSIFYRVAVVGSRLSDLIAIDPTIPTITIAMRNYRHGCWVAFTSQRVAKRIAAAIQQHGLIANQTICGLDGSRIQPRSTDRIRVDEARPWNGDVGSFTPAPDEFFYCIARYDQTVRAFFVPESYWNRHQVMFDGPLGIDQLLSQYLMPESTSGIYTAKHGDLAWIKRCLDDAGFRENLLFQSYINSL